MKYWKLALFSLLILTIVIAIGNCSCGDDDDDDNDGNEDDDSNDDDANNDDDDDDDESAMSCTEAFTWLEETCEVIFFDTEWQPFTRQQVITFCEQGDSYYTQTLDCVHELYPDCEAFMDCLWEFDT
jgi:hypothetical protein